MNKLDELFNEIPQDYFCLKKYSVTISGHKTSYTLEPIFYEKLKEMALAYKVTVSQLITFIDDNRVSNNLSSAIRVFVSFYESRVPLY